MGRLDEQGAVVTGAGRGIGRAIALRLAAEGAGVVLAARTASDIGELAAEIENSGGRGVAITCDVTDPEQVETLRERTEAEVGRPRLVVNCAGRLGSLGPTWEAEPLDWWQDVRTNVRGVFLVTRAFVPGMIEGGAGRIVNLAGGGARGAFPFASAYALSKAAVVRFTETLARELDETGQPVRVFALSPGFVRTDMTRQFAASEAGRRWMGGLADSLQAGEDVSPEHAAEMAVRIAAGDADPWHGRYLHAVEDAGDPMLDSPRGGERTFDADQRRLRVV